MLVNRDSEDITSRLVDNTEAVAFAPPDVNDGPRNFGSALEATNTVDGTGVGDGNDTGGNIAIEEWGSRLLPPVTDLNDL